MLRSIPFIDVLLVLSPMALALAQSPALAAGPESQTFAAGSFNRLTVEQGAGDVTIRASDKDVITVKSTKLDFDTGSCELRVLVKDKALTIINREAGGLLSTKTCEVDFEIEVPARVFADLKVGAGDVEITGLKNELLYKIGAGDVIIKDADLKHLDGQSGTGKVTLEGAIGDATLKIGAGDAHVTLPRAPTKGSLDFRVGTGDAIVALPNGAKVKAQFKSGVGSLTNELGDAKDKDATFTVSGTAGVGDMTIKRL